MPPASPALHWRHDQECRGRAHRGRSPAPVLRAESEAIYAATAAGALGAIFGLIVALIAGTGYWRSRHLPGQEWRLTLASWKFTVNTISVVIVHTALAFLATYAGFRMRGVGFIGLPSLPRSRHPTRP